MNYFVINRKDFIDSWKNLLSKNKFSKYDLNIRPNESETSKYVAVPEGYGDYQYSYEEGYFHAIKDILYSNKFYDSDSMTFPIIFLSRHYIELALKDSIINLLIVTGEPFCLSNYGLEYTCKCISGFNKSNFNFHNLELLKYTLKNILDLYKIDILPKRFWYIINLIDKITPNGDELRYPIDRDGYYNINVNNMNGEGPRNDFLYGRIDLQHLFFNVEYMYNYFTGLRYLLLDYGSLLDDTPYSNPYVEGLLYGFISSINNKHFKNNRIRYINSRIKSYVVKFCTSDLKDIKLRHSHLSKKEKQKRNYELMYPFDIIIEGMDVISVYFNKYLLFTIYGNNDKFFLRTEKLIKN